MLLCQPTRETMGELFTRLFRAVGQADLLLCQPCQPARETLSESFIFFSQHWSCVKVEAAALVSLQSLINLRFRWT